MTRRLGSLLKIMNDSVCGDGWVLSFEKRTPGCGSSQLKSEDAANMSTAEAVEDERDGEGTKWM